MTGSLELNHGQYFVRTRMPDEYGVIKLRCIPTGIYEKGRDRHNKRKALQRKNEILRELESQGAVYKKDMPFVDWLKQWVEEKREHIRFNTYEGYLSYLEKHILPFFNICNKNLKEISSQDLQNYYDLKYKTLSANSLRKHHAIIHGALQEAFQKNLIATNPADRVKLPKIEKFEGKAYNETQIKQLLSAIENESIKPAIILALFYGLRRSEVCGLRWCDIDFDENTMNIRNTVVKGKTVIEHEMTKSSASRRTLSLVPETIPFLKEMKTQQKLIMILQNESFNEENHVCVWEDGRPFSVDYVSQRFKKILKKNNLPDIRFHDLRHTAASWLVNNTDIELFTVKAILGHEKISTTIDIYTHLNNESKKNAAKAMGNLWQE